MITTDEEPAAPLETPRESSNWQVLNRIALGVFFGFAWTMSVPGNSGMSLLLALTGFVAGSVWVLYVIRLRRRPARVGDVALVPLLVLAWVTLASWNLPLEARFSMSKASFEAVAGDIASQTGPDTDRPNSLDLTSVTQTLTPTAELVPTTSNRCNGTVTIFSSIPRPAALVAMASPTCRTAPPATSSQRFSSL